MLSRAPRQTEGAQGWEGKSSEFTQVGHGASRSLEQM